MELRHGHVMSTAWDGRILGDASTAVESISVGIVLGLALQDVHPGAQEENPGERMRTACAIDIY